MYSNIIWGLKSNLIIVVNNVLN